MFKTIIQVGYFIGFRINYRLGLGGWGLLSNRINKWVIITINLKPSCTGGL